MFHQLDPVKWNRMKPARKKLIIASTKNYPNTKDEFSGYGLLKNDLHNPANHSLKKISSKRTPLQHKFASFLSSSLSSRWTGNVEVPWNLLVQVPYLSTCHVGHYLQRHFH